MVVIDGEPAFCEIVECFYEEQYSALADMFIRGGDAFVIQFSITSMQSFEHVQWYVDTIQRIRDLEDAECAIVLVGCKCDLEGDRQVPTATAAAFARNLGIPYVEISCKTSVNVGVPLVAAYRRMRQVEEAKRREESLAIARQGKKKRRKQPPPSKQEKSEEPREFKLVLLGDAGVGKSSLCVALTTCSINTTRTLPPPPPPSIPPIPPTQAAGRPLAAMLQAMKPSLSYSPPPIARAIPSTTTAPTPDHLTRLYERSAVAYPNVAQRLLADLAAIPSANHSEYLLKLCKEQLSCPHLSPALPHPPPTAANRAGTTLAFPSPDDSTLTRVCSSTLSSLHPCAAALHLPAFSSPFEFFHSPFLSSCTVTVEGTVAQSPRPNGDNGPSGNVGSADPQVSVGDVQPLVEGSPSPRPSSSSSSGVGAPKDPDFSRAFLSFDAVNSLLTVSPALCSTPALYSLSELPTSRIQDFSPDPPPPSCHDGDGGGAVVLRVLCAHDCVIVTLNHIPFCMAVLKSPGGYLENLTFTVELTGPQSTIGAASGDTAAQKLRDFERLAETARVVLTPDLSSFLPPLLPHGCSTPAFLSLPAAMLVSPSTRATKLLKDFTRSLSEFSSSVSALISPKRSGHRSILAVPLAHTLTITTVFLSDLSPFMFAVLLNPLPGLSAPCHSSLALLKVFVLAQRRLQELDHSMDCVMGRSSATVFSSRYDPPPHFPFPPSDASLLVLLASHFHSTLYHVLTAPRLSVALRHLASAEFALKGYFFDGREPVRSVVVLFWTQLVTIQKLLSSDDHNCKSSER
eukprot:GCRY01008865.1.p1 GENE.GCRY01008865.1~~GCRY01008865.1.p1  ORF type:complete len:833 (+),score=251.84 GCRY01008865.1:108-2501(+)